MIINALGGLILVISIGACINAGIPEDYDNFTPRHRLMLTMAIAHTIALAMLTH